MELSQLLRRQPFLLRRWHRGLPVCRADETLPPQRQGILPLPPHVRRVHRVGRPEQLEHVGLVDQEFKASGPYLACSKVANVDQVLITQALGEALEFPNNLRVLPRVRRENLAISTVRARL